MKQKLGFLVMIALLLSAVIVAPISAQAAPPSRAVTLPITGGGTAAGGLPVNLTNATATITNFAVQNGQLVANGTLSGQLVDSAGNVLTTITNQAISLPVDLLATTGSCQILDLVLGPINLNLLGLVVTTNQIHLNVTAQSGPGNLLGNLLCAVTNLLNNGGPLNGLAGLLNNILRRL